MNDETIKVICDVCGVANDVKIEWIFYNGIWGIATTGITICWYCNKYFKWEMSKETSSMILGRVRL